MTDPDPIEAAVSNTKPRPRCDRCHCEILGEPVVGSVYFFHNDKQTCFEIEAAVKAERIRVTNEFQGAARSFLSKLGVRI